MLCPLVGTSAVAYTQGAYPPHPAQALLELFNDLTPTLGDDTTWALDFSIEDTMPSSASNVPPETQNDSALDPQRLITGNQQEVAFYEGTDVIGQAVEGDWDLVSGP